MYFISFLLPTAEHIYHFGRYQVIPFGDGGTCVWAACLGVNRLHAGWDWNSWPRDRKSHVLTFSSGRMTPSSVDSNPTLRGDCNSGPVHNPRVFHEVFTSLD